MKRKNRSFFLPAAAAVAMGFAGNFTFQFYGTLGYVDVFALVFVVLMLPTKAFMECLKDRDILHPLLALVAVMVVQLMSDIYNKTDIVDIFKGHANLGFAASSFLFMVIIFRDRINVVIIYLIARSIGQFLFKDLFQTSDEILTNEYWDLRVGFWAAPLVQAGGLIFVNRLRPMVILGLIVYGGAAVAFGGRSHGMVYLAAAITLCLASPNIRTRIASTTRRQVIRGVFAAVVFAAIFFPIYVNLGLQGLITSKAEEQLKELKSPYNPIEVLLAGRKGIQYGTDATFRRPIAGYGSRAYSGDYLPVVEGYNPFIAPRNNIHSMIFECFAFGGIACGFAYLVLMYFTLRRCTNMLASTDYRCIMVAALVAVTFIWSSLGSPLASFRIIWPVTYAMTFAFNLKQPTRNEFLVPRSVYEASRRPNQHLQ